MCFEALLFAEALATHVTREHFRCVPGGVLVKNMQVEIGFSLVHRTTIGAFKLQYFCSRVMFCSMYFEVYTIFEACTIMDVPRVTVDV